MVLQRLLFAPSGLSLTADIDLRAGPLSARSGRNNAMVRQDGFLKAHGPHRENTYNNVGGFSREFINLKLMSYL